MFASSSATFRYFPKREWSARAGYIAIIFFFLFRYFVKATAPHTATLHVQTSNSDVFIKLQVLDNEKEITSVIGKGNAVIPVFNFCSNQSLLSSHCKYCIWYSIAIFENFIHWRIHILTVTLDNHRKYYFFLRFLLIFNFAVQIQ